MIRFLNHECQRKDGKMGTCYSQQECDRVKGKTETSARDICAQGNGICCLSEYDIKLYTHENGHLKCDSSLHHLHFVFYFTSFFIVQGSCGDTVKENNTYFEVKNPENNKICAHKICPFSTNICQVKYILHFLTLSVGSTA